MVPLAAYLLLRLCQFAGVAACAERPDDSNGGSNSGQHAWEQQRSSARAGEEEGQIEEPEPRSG